jgi:hypothetical protein
LQISEFGQMSLLNLRPLINLFGGRGVFQFLQAFSSSVSLPGPTSCAGLFGRTGLSQFLQTSSHRRVFLLNPVSFTSLGGRMGLCRFLKASNHCKAPLLNSIFLAVPPCICIHASSRGMLACQKVCIVIVGCQKRAMGPLANKITTIQDQYLIRIDNRREAAPMKMLMPNLDKGKCTSTLTYAIEIVVLPAQSFVKLA